MVRERKRKGDPKQRKADYKSGKAMMKALTKIVAEGRQ